MRLYDAGFFDARQKVKEMLKCRIITGENETYHIYWNEVYKALLSEVDNLTPAADTIPKYCLQSSAVRNYDDD